MKILLSAYACIPGRGSEPGVGWRWACLLAGQGHEVTVLTRAEYRDTIEEVLQCEPISGLQFVYYELPRWAGWWFLAGRRGVRIHYVLWQLGVRRTARNLLAESEFDLIHHITYGVFRHPSFLADLGPPFVFGPVGGGERAPWALRRGYPMIGIVNDLLRDAANRLASWDPVLRAMFRRSHAILCKTPETISYIPSKYRSKCQVHLEIGTQITSVSSADCPRKEGEFNVLYVGRLIYWKGLHLGLKAFSRLLDDVPEARLTIIGKGRDVRWLQRMVEKLGMVESVNWLQWLDHDELLRLYPKFDVFLFPSLHDSSGNVVLEALNAGLPVICLDLGGPGTMVDESCGRVIATSRANVENVVHNLAAALLELATQPLVREQCRNGALARGEACRWERVVSATYHDLAKNLQKELHKPTQSYPYCK